MKRRHLLKAASAALAAFALTACSCREEARMVRGDGYDAPGFWRRGNVAGHDFCWHVALDYPKWILGPGEGPGLAMTKHPWLMVNGWFGINDLVLACNLDDYDPKKIRYADWMPAYSKKKVKMRPARREWTKLPADFNEVFETVFGGEKRLQTFLSRYPGHPFDLWCSDLRPVLYLMDEFNEDRESYREWKKKYPSFVGFQGLCEFDAEFGSYDNHVMPKIKEQTPDIYERINKAFPVGVDARGMNDRAVEASRRISNFYFGETKLTSLHAICPARAHTAARAGSSYLWYEAELGSCSGPWRLGGAYLRGAARQYGTDYGWYLATYMHYCYTRDGENKPGDLHWPYGRGWTSQFKPYRGCARSLVNRNAFYGLMIGASAEAMEKWGCFFLETDKPTDEPRPSRYMLDFNRIFEINEEIDRGFPFTPVAALVSLDEPYNRSNYFPNFKDPYSQIAFYMTLCPMNVSDFKLRFMGCDRRKGELGCLWNSEFGEIVDVLCPDADQKPADFRKVLSGYKAAFLIGWFNKERFDAASVKEYARGGGTLFVDSEKLDRGLVDAETAGVSFGPGKTAASDEVFEAASDGRETAAEKTAAFRFGEAYTVREAKPTTAKPFLVDASGKVVAWVNDFGKGRVVTVAVDKMLPEALLARGGDWERGVFSMVSGQRKLPVMDYLLRRVQKETLPVEVEGDIQWGVNKTESGWLVWLMNNKGVTKFSCEPEVLDPKAASEVKVTYKPDGRVFTAKVGPGAYDWIVINEKGDKRGK